MNAEATRVRYIVIGVGINVNQASFPAELQPIATSLRLASGKEWSRVELCAALLKSLDREYPVVAGKTRCPGVGAKTLSRAVFLVRDRQVYVDEDDGGYEGTTVRPRCARIPSGDERCKA